ncbi:SRPBCC family protein [Spongiimicrobium salis]|uniref:SRPBCC family protein n=1 Tax=Spongiimicrobium salis TaxID=1667022 RepID=UPI00374D85CD
MKYEDKPILVTHIFNSAIIAVWKALTVHEEMKQWYFSNIPTFETRIGFKTSFIIEVEDRVFPHVWKVMEVDAPYKIAYEWTFEGYPGRGVSYFELTPSDTRTKLNFSFTTLEPFPDTIPEFKRESGVAGWNYFIKERLHAYLEAKKDNK